MQASGTLPLSEEGQVKAGCDELCHSDGGKPFNKGMQMLWENTALLQSQLDTIRDVENVFSSSYPENLVADDWLSPEKRLKEAIV